MPLPRSNLPLPVCDICALRQHVCVLTVTVCVVQEANKQINKNLDFPSFQTILHYNSVVASLRRSSLPPANTKHIYMHPQCSPDTNLGSHAAPKEKSQARAVRYALAIPPARCHNECITTYLSKFLLRSDRVESA